MTGLTDARGTEGGESVVSCSPGYVGGAKEGASWRHI